MFTLAEEAGSEGSWSRVVCFFGWVQRISVPAFRASSRERWVWKPDGTFAPRLNKRISPQSVCLEDCAKRSTRWDLQDYSSETRRTEQDTQWKRMWIQGRLEDLLEPLCVIFIQFHFCLDILKAFLAQDGDNDKTMRMHPVPSMSPVTEVLRVGNLLRGKQRDTSHECTTQRRLHKL